MPVTVIVGGQFGSEGKGKVAKCIAEATKATVAIRCGGPNSGHTIINDKGHPVIFQQLPTACIIPDVISVLCAGMYIDIEILLSEIVKANIDEKHLFIDPKAVIITEEIKECEQNNDLQYLIGSTASGTGEAVIRRIQRKSDIVFAGEIAELRPYVRNVSDFLRERLDRGERIILEGTQGFGLSLIHSSYYPNVTSRDTTASGFLAEAGLSPLDVDDVVLVIRAFPIRVAGNSGPLPNEIDWNILTKESCSPDDLTERTSVTNKIRRVARFDADIVRQAIKINKPSRIVLNHLDYVDYNVREQGMTEIISDFMHAVSKDIESKIDIFGTNPTDVYYINTDSNKYMIRS